MGGKIPLPRTGGAPARAAHNVWKIVTAVKTARSSVHDAGYRGTSSSVTASRSSSAKPRTHFSDALVSYLMA